MDDETGFRRRCGRSCDQRKVVEPLFEELYQSVLSGKEARTVLEANTAPDCREKVEKEVEEMRNSEMSRAGAMVRSPRPEKWKKQN